MKIKDCLHDFIFKHNSLKSWYNIWEGHHPEKAFRSVLNKQKTGLPFFVYIDDGVRWNTIHNCYIIQIQNNCSEYYSQDVFYLSINSSPIIVKGHCKLSEDDYGKAIWFVEQNLEALMKVYSPALTEYGYAQLVRDLKRWHDVFKTKKWETKYIKTKLARVKETLIHNYWLLDWFYTYWKNKFPDKYYKYKLPNSNMVNIYVDAGSHWKYKKCVQVQGDSVDTFDNTYCAGVFSKNTFYLSIEDEPKIIKGKCCLPKDELNSVKEFVKDNKDFLLSIDEEDLENLYFNDKT